MVSGSYAGQSFGLDIDKKQEKVIIYVVFGTIMLVLAYYLYTMYQGVEGVKKGIGSIFKAPTDIYNSVEGLLGLNKPAVNPQALVQTDITMIPQLVNNFNTMLNKGIVTGVTLGTAGNITSYTAVSEDSYFAPTVLDTFSLSGYIIKNGTYYKVYGCDATGYNCSKFEPVDASAVIGLKNLT